LLVVIAIISILAAMLLPALSRAKESGKRISCTNNQHQLGLAAQVYLGDYAGFYPPRSNTNRWPSVMADTYAQNFKLLVCPSEQVAAPLTGSNSNYPADVAPRTYFINGWNDFFNGANAGDRMKENAILHVSDTVIFGEKAADHMDYYLDLLLSGGEDFIGVLDQEKHGVHQGANYTFADGSVRYLKKTTVLYPYNLWAVLDNARLLFQVVP
jgi:prepilin-type processing-associated H-X9-DG protein